MFTLAAAVAAWTFSIEGDPITDREVATVVAPDRNRKVAFTLKCMGRSSGRLMLYALSTEYLGGQGGSSQARKVFYRVDDGAASFLTGIYNRNSVTVAPDYETQRFVKLAATARNRVAIRLETYAGDYVDADLTASGSSASIGKIMDFCFPK